MNSSLYH